jgi:hypothetical protein
MERREKSEFFAAVADGGGRALLASHPSHSNGNATEWAAAGLQTPAPLELNRGEPEGEPEPELAPELPTVVT